MSLVPVPMNLSISELRSTRLTSAFWKVLQHSSISQAASISPAGWWSNGFNGWWDENEIPSRPARFISRNRLSEEPIWLQNLRLNPLKKSSWSECVNCGKLRISVTLLCSFCHILRLKLLQVIAPCWRTPKAGKASRLSTSAMITIFGAFGITIYTKREITGVTSNAICFESNSSKTSENIKTEVLSHYSSWSSCFVACLNDNWHVGSHVHAGKTIAAASALQISSHLNQDCLFVSGKVCFILRGCLAAKSQIMAFVLNVLC